MQIQIEVHSAREIHIITDAMRELAVAREEEHQSWLREAHPREPLDAPAPNDAPIVLKTDDYVSDFGTVKVVRGEDAIVAAPEPIPTVATEQLMTLMREAAGRAGLPAVAKLMETYGATRVSDIPADRSAAFAADLGALSAVAA